ncbi:MAG: hypothetical protein HY077_09415 [Elusimicrobia bacterium]|nr:hypothetical protein [Elusimicrobiota bacterium]
MIRVRYLASFDGSFAALDTASRSKIRRALRRLLDYFAGGGKPLGMGLRKWREPYWEIRAGLDLRVVFALEKDLASFILVGSHDEIRRCLDRR